MAKIFVGGAPFEIEQNSGEETLFVHQPGQVLGYLIYARLLSNGARGNGDEQAVAKRLFHGEVFHAETGKRYHLHPHSYLYGDEAEEFSLQLEVREIVEKSAVKEDQSLVNNCGTEMDSLTLTELQKLAVPTDVQPTSPVKESKRRRRRKRAQPPTMLGYAHASEVLVYSFAPSPH